MQQQCNVKSNGKTLTWDRQAGRVYTYVWLAHVPNQIACVQIMRMCMNSACQMSVETYVIKHADIQLMLWLQRKEQFADVPYMYLCKYATQW